MKIYVFVNYVYILSPFKQRLHQILSLKARYLITNSEQNRQNFAFITFIVCGTLLTMRRARAVVRSVELYV